MTLPVLAGAALAGGYALGRALRGASSPARNDAPIAAPLRAADPLDGTAAGSLDSSAFGGATVGASSPGAPGPTVPPGTTPPPPSPPPAPGPALPPSLVPKVAPAGADGYVSVQTFVSYAGAWTGSPPVLVSSKATTKLPSITAYWASAPIAAKYSKGVGGPKLLRRLMVGGTWSSVWVDAGIPVTKV